MYCAILFALSAFNVPLFIKAMSEGSYYLASAALAAAVFNGVLGIKGWNK